MTVPACPVCATPHAPDAEVCEFCGVSLREPEVEAEAATEDQVADPATTAQAHRVSGAMAAANDDALDPGVAEDTAARPEDVADESPGDTRGDIPEESAGDALDDLPNDTIPDVAGDDAQLEEAAPADAQAHDASIQPETPGISEVSAPVTPAGPRTRAPSFARKPTASDHAHRRLQRIEWGVVAALGVALLVQVVASDFDQLAAGSATRPWLQRMCTALRCELPPWRETQALRLLQRDVRANPQRHGTLRVSASFRNDARWAQPWPRLRVVLSDADGRAIAARDFAASEYLGATPTSNGIASGQVAGAAFDVVDPSSRVTAFTFEFRDGGVANPPHPR